MKLSKNSIFPIVIAGLIIIGVISLFLDGSGGRSRRHQVANTSDETVVADTSVNNASSSNISFIHNHFKTIDECCPIETAPNAFISSVSCDDEAKIVTYVIKTSDNHPQAYANQIAQSFFSNNRLMALYQYTFFEADEENLRLQDAMIEEGYSERVCIFDDNNKELYSQTIDVETVAELKQFAQNHPKEAKYEVITAIVNEYNKILPLDWGEGLYLQSVYFQDGSTPYTVFRLYAPKDIEISDVMDLINDPSFLREYITDPFFDQALVLTHSVNSGIKFTAVSYNRRDSLTAVFSPSRLKGYADVAYQKKHRI